MRFIAFAVIALENTNQSDNQICFAKSLFIIQPYGEFLCLQGHLHP